MKYRILFTLVILGILFATSYCAPAGNNAGLPDKPVAALNAPSDGEQFVVGQNVTLKFGATDVTGVVQMEITINGLPIYVETIDPPVNAFVADYVWIPEEDGSYVIQATAFSLDGDSSDPVQVVVMVGDAAVELPTPTSAEQLPLATDTPTPRPVVPTPGPASANDQVLLKPIVTALISLNVRTGPGTAYPVIGRLPEGQSAEIVGRDGFGYWWQIIFPSGSDQMGWVAAGSDFSTAINAGSVPEVEILPQPTTDGTTDINATPESASEALKPTIYSFIADRYTINQGESVTLSWDLANAEAAYLRYNNVEEGVVSPGSKTVAPDSETQYTLVARNNVGETTAQITINVGGPAPTAVPVYRDGKTRIVAGQSIDFDQGVVQDTIGPDVDFYWDGAKKQFTPQRGATGTLLGMGYGDIHIEQCLAATYGQPINANPSSLLAGCYKTSQGRYGKFYISDWDLAGNLTIEWLTWDY